MSEHTKSLAVEGVAYCCAPHVVWARDVERVILVDSQDGRSWALDGIEAAVWDWLATGYPYERVVHFVALTRKTLESEAGARLDSILRRWCDAGLIQQGGAT